MRIKNGVTKICPVCGEFFYLRPSEVKKGIISCSTACKAIRYKGRSMPHTKIWGQHISEAKKGKINLAGRKSKIFKVCEYCNNEFEVSRHRAIGQNYKARFCSLTCWYNFIRSKPENHPSYKGGYEPYYGPNWPKQRRLCLMRDGYKCRSCGRKIRSIRLDVHHIRPFREFNNNWQKANELGNLITFCLQCHTKAGANHCVFQLPAF